MMAFRRVCAVALAVVTGGMGAVSAAPFTLSINSDWSTNTSLLATVQNGNDGRGIAYDGTNVIIAIGDSTEREVHVVSAANGAPIHQLGLTAGDPYDVDGDSNTGETFSLNTSVGPYKLATARAGGGYAVYMCAFPAAAAGRVIVRYNATTSGANPSAVAIPVDLAGTTAIDERSLDVVGTGTSTLLYAPTTNGTTSQAFRIYTTTDSNKFTTSTLTDVAARHENMVTAKDTNTGGNGDVVWVSASGQTIRKFVRSGGVWALDNRFSQVLTNGTLAGSTGYSANSADYVSINGQDVLVMMRATSVADPERNRIYFLSGDTGAVLGTFTPTLNGSYTSAGNGGVVCVPTGANTGYVYYVAPDRHTYGRISYSATGFTLPVVEDEVVVNEMAVGDTGTDNLEYIELKGPAGKSLAGLELALTNGGGIGEPYDTIDLSTVSLDGSGYLAVSGGPDIPGAFVDPNGLATDWLQNGDPDSVVLRSKFDGLVIDAAAYATQYDSTPGTAELGLLSSWAYENRAAGHEGDDSYVTQTGFSIATQTRSDATIGRVPDGLDTQNNLNDFVTIYAGRTTGTANSGVFNTAFHSEDFGSPSGLDRLWAPLFAPVLFETAGTAVPASIPNSPDAVTPTQWASVKNPTGDGDVAIVADYVGTDYNVAADFYCGTISTAVFPDAEYGALVARLSGGHQSNLSEMSYQMSSPVGMFGESFYAVEMNYTSGTVQAVKVDRSVKSTVGAAQNVGTGWHRLGIAMVGGDILFQLNGATFAQLSGETPRPGYAGVAYREVTAGSGTVRNNFDAFAISAGVVPVEVSRFLVD